MRTLVVQRSRFEIDVVESHSDFSISPLAGGIVSDCRDCGVIPVAPNLNSRRSPAVHAVLDNEGVIPADGSTEVVITFTPTRHRTVPA